MKQNRSNAAVFTLYPFIPMRNPLPCRRFAAALLLAASLLSLAKAAAAPIPVNVLTYHNDDARTGQNLHETQLTPANVNAGQFGKRFASPVDGQVYAQPLYLAGAVIKGQGRRNVVFIATEHDSVYAFDADNGALLWQTHFLDPAAGVTSVPAQEVFGCQQITPELGITATPALDPETGTIYVVAMTREASGAAVNYVQRLHALDTRSGAEKPGSPVEVQTSVRNSSGETIRFVPHDYKERPGLVLRDGVVYTSWSSHCDAGKYYGWVIGYDAGTLQQTAVYNVTPDGDGASFWMSGAAPAVDAAGHLFLVGGNGSFNAQDENGGAAGGRDLGESVVKLSTKNRQLRATDYFTPFNKDILNRQDLDIGSSGAMLYDAGGRHLLTTAGKEGRIYVLDRTNLGKFHPGDDSQTVQSLPAGPGALGGPLFGIPAFFNSGANGPTLYFAAVEDHPRAFRLDAQGRLPAAPTSQAPEKFGYPGSVPSISANGDANGIAWMLESGGNGTLRAYDADNLANELYASNQAPGQRDALGGYVKFTVPTVTQGRVYVGTDRQLVAYGLLAPPAAADVSARVNVMPGEAAPSLNGRFLVQTATVTNISDKPIPAPIALALDGLNNAASLVNARGTTTVTSPAGSFYAEVKTPGEGLAPGQSASVRLKFVNSKNGNIRWTPRVLAGPGGR